MVYYVDHSKAVVLLYSYYLFKEKKPGFFEFLNSSSVYTSQFVNSSCVLESFSDSGIA